MKPSAQTIQIAHHLIEQIAREFGATSPHGVASLAMRDLEAHGLLRPGELEEQDGWRGRALGFETRIEQYKGVGYIVLNIATKPGTYMALPTHTAQHLVDSLQQAITRIEETE